MYDVANRKILAYQLDTLIASGVKQVFIVTPTDYYVALRDFLHVYEKDSIEIDLIPVNDVDGSTDLLLALSDRIHSQDVIVASSDYISQHLLTHIANIHREKSADITVTCATLPYEEAEKGSKITLKSPKIDPQDQEHMGFCEDNRLVIKVPSYEVEEAFRMNKFLLRRCVSITLRNDMIDVGCYAISKWIFQLLRSKQHLANVRTEVIPYIVNRQFQRADYLYQNLAAIQGRAKPLEDLDAWLAQTSVKEKRQVVRSVDKFSSFASVNDASSTDDDGGSEDKKTDILRCYAVVRENLPSNSSQEENTICRRITSLQAYMNINKYVT